jgi:hypothetical protein
MTRKVGVDLGTSLIVAVGIVVSTGITVLAAESGWLVLAGPLLLALAFVGADVLRSRLNGESSGPSWAALLLGASFLLAGVIVALRDPSLVSTLIPAGGSAGWVSLFLVRPEGRRCELSLKKGT